jgi:hypothetical protein
MLEGAWVNSIDNNCTCSGDRTGWCATAEMHISFTGKYARLATPLYAMAVGCLDAQSTSYFLEQLGCDTPLFMFCCMWIMSSRFTRLEVLLCWHSQL